MNVGGVAAGAERQCAPATLDRALLGGPSTSPLDGIRPWNHPMRLRKESALAAASSQGLLWR